MLGRLAGVRRRFGLSPSVTSSGALGVLVGCSYPHSRHHLPGPSGAGGARVRPSGSRGEPVVSRIGDPLPGLLASIAVLVKLNVGAECWLVFVLVAAIVATVSAASRARRFAMRPSASLRVWFAVQDCTLRQPAPCSGFSDICSTAGRSPPASRSRCLCRDRCGNSLWPSSASRAC